MPVHLNLNSDFQINAALLYKRAERLLHLCGFASHAVVLTLVDDKAMAELNQRYRHRRGATNVLSFPFAGDEPGTMDLRELGDIIISTDTALKEAEELGCTLHERLTVLMIHGLVHLLGYDHERSDREARQMFALEKKLKKQLYTRRLAMPRLAVNVDHTATVRQARGVDEPDPVIAAGICELAGAVGIVVHLREDRRHIQDRDVRLLRQTIKTRLNLEMAASKEMLGIAEAIKPDMVTFVPEKRQELTTEGGIDVCAQEKKINKAIARMTKAGIPVSLFIDPDKKQIKAAADVGATFVELHTGRYCDALNAADRDMEFALIEQSAEQAFERGLRVNAGHGLDYRNTPRIAALPAIEELSIGHAIISRAVYVGLDQAVREMLALIAEAG